MFEQLTALAARRAEAQARQRASAIQEALANQLPRDLRVEAAADAVRIIGRGASERILLDADLRWTIRRVA